MPTVYSAGALRGRFAGRGRWAATRVPGRPGIRREQGAIHEPIQLEEVPPALQAELVAGVAEATGGATTQELARRRDAALARLLAARAGAAAEAG